MDPLTEPKACKSRKSTFPRTEHFLYSTNHTLHTPGKLEVAGNVVLPDGVTSLATGSCLRMSIREEILCQECEVPERASFRISNPVVGNGGKIAYQMTIDSPNADIRFVYCIVFYFL